MKNHSHWICSKILMLKYRTNSTKESKASYLIVVVNAVEDMTIEMNDV